MSKFEVGQKFKRGMYAPPSDPWVIVGVVETDIGTAYVCAASTETRIAHGVVWSEEELSEDATIWIEEKIEVGDRIQFKSLEDHTLRTVVAIFESKGAEYIAYEREGYAHPFVVRYSEMKKVNR